jgi:hypothetical protein
MHTSFFSSESIRLIAGLDVFKEAFILSKSEDFRGQKWVREKSVCLEVRALARPPSPRVLFGWDLLRPKSGEARESHDCILSLHARCICAFFCSKMIN